MNGPGVCCWEIMELGFELQKRSSQRLSVTTSKDRGMGEELIKDNYGSLLGSKLFIHSFTQILSQRYICQVPTVSRELHYALESFNLWQWHPVQSHGFLPQSSEAWGKTIPHWPSVQVLLGRHSEKWALGKWGKVLSRQWFRKSTMRSS